MPANFNPNFYTTPKNIRPLTESEMTVYNLCELLGRCEPEMYLVHVAVIKNIKDDLAAVNAYCCRELELIDARSQRQDERDLQNAGCN